MIILFRSVYYTDCVILSRMRRLTFRTVVSRLFEILYFLCKIYMYNYCCSSCTYMRQCSEDLLTRYSYLKLCRFTTDMNVLDELNLQTEQDYYCRYVFYILL